MLCVHILCLIASNVPGEHAMYKFPLIVIHTSTICFEKAISLHLYMNLIPVECGCPYMNNVQKDIWHDMWHGVS